MKVTHPMLARRFLADRRGSAVQWFAYAAVGVTLTCVVCAQGLARFVKSGTVPVIAFVPISERSVRTAHGDGLDRTPTGTVKFIERIVPEP